jgi:uncharacterized protein (DUF58 family)
MKATTELEIENILQRIAFCGIPIDWKSEDPLPGVGERKSKYRGPGADYVEFVPFEDGDDPRHINWAMTARATDDDVIWRTVHQEEKEVKSVVLVKIGHSMDFGTVRTTKRHLAAEQAASVFFALDKTRDKGGCIVYSRDEVLEDLQPKAAMTTLYPALEAILECDPYKPAAIEQKGDGLSKALSGLPLQKSLVFIISDFEDMSERDWLELGNTACYHDVVCIYVQDRRERELPKLPGIFGWLGCFYVLQDYNGNRRLIWNNTATRRKYAANFQKHEAGIITSLEDRLCQSMVVSTEEGDAAISKVLDLFSGHC